MATERQMKANQRNAQLSTGPRTAEGRAKSAQNGRPHGFCSEYALITSPEDRAAYDEITARYSAQYDNGNAECREQIQHLVHAEFQRRMIARAEAGHFHESILHAIDHLWGKQRLPDDAAVNENLLTRMVGITVMRDLRKDEVFLKMSRYEGEKLRNFNRALGILKRNLANGAPAGLNEPECPPVAIDSTAEPLHIEAEAISGLSESPQDPAPTTPSTPSVSEVVLDPAPSCALSVSDGITEPQTDIPTPDPTPDRALSVSDGLTEPSADIPTAEKTIENPISGISQPNQSPTLCKNDPEIDSCTVCRHPEHETLREILTLPHDIHKISAKWNIPVLDLWRCRLHHLEDPTHFYSIIGAAARKSRLFDATDLNPQVILDEDPIEDFENGQEQSYAA